ncbi:hypothetical protein I350_02537 [Cryptococcus amylolentus CBS 6273]|uniref:Uncharacterized protein n=1 Tax=Cryptococcus amylolentus CBS 6273 TaxID=1296118 RepID=A0A1E3KAZ8_9TREE|nr:hypothetical protein I350_02537 [Cryptococcus amylolentus CBS 6273]
MVHGYSALPPPTLHQPTLHPPTLHPPTQPPPTLPATDDAPPPTAHRTRFLPPPAVTPPLPPPTSDSLTPPPPKCPLDFLVVGGCNWTYLTVVDVLPAANKTRFQVPVEAAFNCSSSEKLFLGVVARIAETEEANELERGDRIQLEEKKGLTKIAGAEKCSL